MKTTGLRGRYSPMNNATPEQEERIGMLRVQAEREGKRQFEVRHPSAYLRLVAELGDNLADILLFALAGPQGRRGSSSP